VFVSRTQVSEQDTSITTEAGQFQVTIWCTFTWSGAIRFPLRANRQSIKSFFSVCSFLGHMTTQKKIGFLSLKPLAFQKLSL